MTENELATIVIGEAIDIHKKLGPGLLEKVYQECLFSRLTKKGLNVIKEKPIPVVFEDVKMDCGYRADLIVEGKLVIEAKAVDNIAPVFVARTLTYLKFSGCKLGLLINFNVVKLVDGIRRVVYKLEEPDIRSA